MVETPKIILVCVLAAIVYGAIDDQITARICIEYFTIFHPPILATKSPTVLGLGMGSYCDMGGPPVPWVLLLTMGCCAMVAGFAGLSWRLTVL